MVTCEKFNKHGDPRLRFIWSAIKQKKKSFMMQSFDKFIVS